MFHRQSDPRSSRDPEDCCDWSASVGRPPLRDLRILRARDSCATNLTLRVIVAVPLTTHDQILPVATYINRSSHRSAFISVNHGVMRVSKQVTSDNSVASNNAIPGDDTVAQVAALRK